MSFTTDRQTLEDLNIFGKHGLDSVYSIYNRCMTRGGAAILEEMFRYPLSNHEAINRRSSIIQYFAEKGSLFPFSFADFDSIGIYLSNTDQRSKLSAQEHSVGKQLGNMIAPDAETQMIHKGIVALTGLLQGLGDFLGTLDLNEGDGYYLDAAAISALLAEPVFLPILGHGKGKLTAAMMAGFDAVFRFRNRDAVQKLLRYIYFLDVYLSVARVAVDRGFIFPKAMPKDKNELVLDGVYHPQVENAVANSVRISPAGNVIFLTGANMAGKSTFMKSLSVCLFLAHIGFPVAAAKMDFSVLDGIYTTINLPDNLGMGASHFYAEVLRVKKMAIELAQGKYLFILFDELFRGTNVKDAYEATIAITAAFASKSNSIFVISTHIIEAGEVLRKQCGNVRFLYLPTKMEGTSPIYTYMLEEGITDDRHGMVIIRNEGISGILDQGINSKAHGSESRETEHFIADKQTLEDLNLRGKYKPNSVYSLFNHVRTSGGERLLEEMFQAPLTHAAKINRRSSIFRYFQHKRLEFPFQPEVFGTVESYLGMGSSGNFVTATGSILLKKIADSLLRGDEFHRIYTGLKAAIAALKGLKAFLGQLELKEDNPYKGELEIIHTILGDSRLNWLAQQGDTDRLTVLQVAKYDYLLRYTLRSEMEQLLTRIYHLDVYITVAEVANSKDFSCAKALPEAQNQFHAVALRHPALENGVANSLSFDKDNNLLFLTGANMAGKSTFMKAFGIAVYLAHMGFPVAAKEMTFSVRDGIYSSINVPDNLNLGLSHFYAEVLRVKQVAEEVASGKNLVVLFDELFKGTNVKDAYDGTLSVTAAFARFRNCFYVVSTHIIEVGQALKEEGEQVNFAYLPTVMEGNVPKYTYRLKEGITSDRQGMMIIENEGLLEILDS